MRGHIRQRSKGSYEIAIDIGRDLVTGRRRQHFETVRGNKANAQKRLAELMVEIQKGGYVRTPRDLTVAEYLRSWLSDYVAMNCALTTQESYRYLIERHIIPEIGLAKLATLEARHLQALYSKKKDSGLSDRTVRYVYSLLVQALEQAVKIGLINRNVARATEPPRMGHKVMPILTLQNIDQFIEAAKQTPYYILFYLLLHTGLRRGEALALKWKHVELDLPSLEIASYLCVTQSLSKVNRQLLVKEPKSSAGKRRVAMSPSLALVLRQYRTEQKAQKMLLGKCLSEEDYVFCNIGEVPLDPSTVSHAFKKIIRRAGLPPVSLHSLRHTHATLLLQAGTHPRIVMERLGHSSIRITLDTYSHVVGGLQEVAAQRFDDFLSAKSNDNANVGKMLAKP